VLGMARSDDNEKFSRGEKGGWLFYSVAKPLALCAVPI